ncbi:uncharacterized protein LOC117502215 [Thalassophryne amazonica]|uniref:uncharacterized protein LOC117502215 n=1 Tax=Thalassophryne amazonica TaxID=390379 RepID=UPI0014713D9F|nr:uncharacterized protein LOC117502215 [Thalassophryne amazonica]
MTYLTPSPYLTPNPPDCNSTSYLTFGPGGGSTGVVTYSTGGHTHFQSQKAGQILLQPVGHHGGISAYQSFLWGNMYSQQAAHQRSHSSTYSGSSQDLQQPSTAATLPPTSFFPRRDHLSSHANSHTQIHATATTSSTSTVLPPISTLRASHLKAESTPPKIAPLLPPEISSASPHSSTAPSCEKIEYDSPRQVHSHFHCDFSPIHF